MATYEVRGDVAGASEEPQGGGYFNASYYANQGKEQTEVLAQESQTSSTIEELSNKLGVDPTQLGAPQEEAVEQAPPSQDEPDKEKEDFLAKFNTEEGKRFKDQFKQFLGIDPVEAYELMTGTSQLVQHLDTWRREVQQERQVAQLRQEFGSDFEAVMPKVVERFQQLPKAMQVSLDNIEGARLLAAQIRQEELSQRSGRPNPYASTNVRPLQRSGNTAPVIRMSEFVNWSDAEVQQRMPEIMKAKQNGTFINDL
jgi:DNA-binding protein H-NS